MKHFLRLSPNLLGSGFDNGEINAFNRDYPESDTFYASFRAQFGTPNREAEEYRTTWPMLRVRLTDVFTKKSSCKLY